MSVIRKILFAIIWAVCRFLSLFLYPRKIIHSERIPKKSKYVGVANHQHWADIVYIFVWGRGRLYMVAKKELREKSGFLRVMHKEIGIIFVDRDSPSLSSIKSILTALKRDRPLLVFPEGTRNKSGEVGSLLPVKPGAAIFAIKAQAPMIPMMIYKPAKLFRKNYLYIGEPFDFSEFYGQKLSEEVTEAANEKMRTHMLLELENMRDYVENKRWKKKNRT